MAKSVSGKSIWNLPDESYGKNIVILLITKQRKFVIPNCTVSEADELFGISLELERQMKKDDPKRAYCTGHHAWQNETGRHAAYIVAIPYKRTYRETMDSAEVAFGLMKLKKEIEGSLIRNIYVARPKMHKHDYVLEADRINRKLDGLDDRFTIVS